MQHNKKSYLPAIINLLAYAAGYILLYLILMFSDSPYLILFFYIFIPLCITLYAFIYSARLAGRLELPPARKRLVLLGVFELPLIPLTLVLLISDLIRGCEILFSDYTFLIVIALIILISVLCGCNLSGRLRNKRKKG